MDFNRDGIAELGIGKTCNFPPLDAPESFKHAWLAATRDMSEEDVPDVRVDPLGRIASA